MQAEDSTATEAMTSKVCAKLWSRIAPIYLLLIFALLEVATVVQKSPTVDEPIHLFAGYSYLKWSDFRANPEHPPLAKVWAALPLLAFDLKDPRPSRPHWNWIPEDLHSRPTVHVARDFLFVDNDGERLFFFAKLQMIIIGICLGLAVFLLSKNLFGLKAAVAALFIYVLDPNMLAHSQIIHTDLPFAAVFFVSSYFFWRFLEHVSWRNLVVSCLGFGVAAITKYSYIVILPFWAVLGLVHLAVSGRPISVTQRVRAFAGRWRRVMLLALILASASATAYLLVWAAYGFHYDAIPGESPHFHTAWVLPDEGSLARPIAELAAGQHLFPEAWLYGQLYVHKYKGRMAYLFGEVSKTGLWIYFPVAFAVKTPLPTQLLLAIGLWMLVSGRLDRKSGLFLLTPAILYFLAAIYSNMNIGLRHVLPVYPFLFVLSGAAAAQLWQGGSCFKRGALVLLSLWYIVSCFWTYPHYLAYFNELVGGPRNGHKVLLDSNLDWGQDLKALKRWMDQNGVKNIQFIYFGNVDPEHYGIDAVYLPGSWIRFDPPATRASETPKYVAVSAHLLFYELRDKEPVKSFLSKTPVAIIGHSIYVFEATEARNPLIE
jgi:4-amino-4-deoxy-L-arabinose transferase-like glycosyltransferase